MKMDLYEMLGTSFANQKKLQQLADQKPNIFVGWVDSYNDATKTINVLPAIQDNLVDVYGKETTQNKPFLVNCWVIANTLTRKPKSGDKCLVLVLDEKANNFFKANYDSSQPLENQTFAKTDKAYKKLSNCVAIIYNPKEITHTDIDVIDNLTSTNVNDALSANQGRILNEALGLIENDVTNNMADISSLQASVLALIQNGVQITSANIAQNGYIRYNNGLTLQWGEMYSSGAAIPTTFPIAFTTKVFAIAGMNINSSTTNTTSTIKAVDTTLTGTTFYCPFRTSSSSGAGFTNSDTELFTWFAIGV